MQHATHKLTYDANMHAFQLTLGGLSTFVAPTMALTIHLLRSEDAQAVAACELAGH